MSYRCSLACCPSGRSSPLLHFLWVPVMPISFACGNCRKSYQLDDGLAGKKARCKQCGNEFRIPDLKSKPAAKAHEDDGLDPYGLAEPDGHSAPSPYDAEFSPSPPPKPRRIGSVAPSRSQSTHKVNEQLQSVGFGLIGFGVLALVLPFLGLQHRVLVALPDEAQAGIGILVALAGGICLLFAHVRAAKAIAIGAAVSFGFIVLCIALYSARSQQMPAKVGVAENRRQPGAANGKQSGIRPPSIPEIPAPSWPPKPPTPPAFPRQFVSPTNPAPSRSPGGQPSIAQNPTATPHRIEQSPPATSAGGAETKIKLTNARSWKEQKFSRFEPAFSVDYEVTSVGKNSGFRYIWVIQTAGNRAQMSVNRLQTAGRLTGSMFGPKAPGGPYECYLAVETFGPRGRETIKVSDTVTMQEVGSRPSDPEPRGKPLFPGAIAGNTPPMPNGVGQPSDMPQPGGLQKPPAVPGQPQPAKAASGDQITNYLADINAGEPFRARAAADNLAKLAPEEARRQEVVDALLTMTRQDDVFSRDAASKALAIWGDVKNLDDWLKLLEDSHFPVRWTAMDVLANLKDSKGAEAIVRRYKVDKIQAKKALTQMGSVAEPAVQSMLKDVEWPVRMDACEILKSIGTKSSVAVLNKALRDENGIVKMKAQEALQTLGAGANTSRKR